MQDWPGLASESSRLRPLFVELSSLMYQCSDKFFGRASLSLSSARISHGDDPEKSFKSISNCSLYLMRLPNSCCFVNVALCFLTGFCAIDSSVLTMVIEKF